MSSRRVLITGAGGFVGRALATGFADLGWDVVGVDRSFDDDWSDDRIERIVADLEGDLEVELPSGMPEADVVVHAAWITTDPETLGITPAEYERRNILALETMLGHVARTGAETFVFLSSSGVFGPNDGSAGLTDTDRPTGDSPYAKAKLRAECLVLDGFDVDDGPAGEDAMSEATTATLVVRLGYLFGPREVARPTRPGVSLVARWFEAARDGRPLEVRADDPAREWTFAPDLAAALERVVEGGGVDHPIHLGSPHVLKDSQLATLIADQAPGTEIRTVPAVGPVKPPMTRSDIPVLRDFAWTGVRDGLGVIASTIGPARSADSPRERSA